MIKYEYETGMCKQLHYNGLWSVQYEVFPDILKSKDGLSLHQRRM